MDQTVLVVEDDAAIGTLLRVLLEGDGLRVDVARTGHQAMELAAEREPVVTIVDIGLPGLNGATVAVGLRCRYRRLPIIVVSALPEPAVAQTARECEATAYFTKPFETEALLAAVRRAASRQGAEAAA
jgi:DNA-binding response OmpR family regulator